MQVDVTNTPIYQGAAKLTDAVIHTTTVTMVKGEVWETAISTAALKEGRALKMVVKDHANPGRPEQAYAMMDVYEAPNGSLIWSSEKWPFTDAGLEVHYLYKRVEILGGDRWSNAIHGTMGMPFQPFETLSYGTMFDGCRGDPAKVDVAVERCRNNMCVEIGLDLFKVDTQVPLPGDKAESDREKRAVMHVYLGWARHSATLANWRSAENVDAGDRILTSLAQFKILRCVGPKPKGTVGVHPAVDKFWRKIGPSVGSVRGKLPEIIVTCISGNGAKESE